MVTKYSMYDVIPSFSSLILFGIDLNCVCMCQLLIVSDSLQPHGLQPIRPLCPRDLQARTLEWVAISFSKRNYRKKESDVVQSCLTLWDLMDCSLPGSSIHGIFQARVLEWGAIAFSITHYQRNENQNYNGISHHTSQNGHHQSVYKQ